MKISETLSLHLIFYNQWLCGLFSGLLLYSLLSSFVWMFIEGFHFYQMTVNVFVFRTRNNFSMFIGYGTPVLIISIATVIIWLKESYILFDINSDFYL
jgi:hypothetical protein